MSKIKLTFFIILAFCISVIAVVMGSTDDAYFGAQTSYRVYLEGESIGLIQSKDELEEYIDNESQKIKELYNINKVYAPAGLDIKEEITYNTKMESVKSIYDKIKGANNFTIDGYVINITKTESGENKGEGTAVEEVKTLAKIYTIDKEVWEEAIRTTIFSFIDENKYELYLTEAQPEIVETGRLIERVALGEYITIKQTRIPINETVYSDSKELAKFLLFSNNENPKTYKIKGTETISEIAEKHKLNVGEFLIANRDIAGENALLSQGQEVVVSLIAPVITIIEESHEVVLQEIDFKIETTNDSSMYSGEVKVTQEGEKGQSLVTKKIKTDNGQVTSAVIVNTQEIKPPVNKKVRTGNKTDYVVGGTEFWAWPTKIPYVLTDPWGPRWGSFHYAQDISGTGHGSPIYAIQAGTVTTSEYNSNLGNYVVINHNNGYTSSYSHLHKSYVVVGQAVSMGQVIGGMGDTGFSFGTHLHFQVSKNGSWINPLLIYR